VINPDGSAPFLLLSDHSSHQIPRALGTLGLEESDLQRHVAYDIGADATSRKISELCDAPLLATCYSRLVIDPNRHLRTPTSIPLASEDVIVPGNHDLSNEQILQRESTLFYPYHDAVQAQIKRFLDQGRVPGIISIHSFTPAFLGFERPWHIGVLWHRDPRFPLPLLERLRQEPDLVVGDNEPYSARNPEGYTMEYHADRNGYPNVLLEIRQDLIAHADGVEHWSKFLASTFNAIYRDPTLYQVEVYENA
jgi:predicted N-formylglutamate amidohydrolase